MAQVTANLPLGLTYRRPNTTHRWLHRSVAPALYELTLVRIVATLLLHGVASIMWHNTLLSIGPLELLPMKLGNDLVPVPASAPPTAKAIAHLLLSRLLANRFSRAPCMVAATCPLSMLEHRVPRSVEMLL